MNRQRNNYGPITLNDLLWMSVERIFSIDWNPILMYRSVLSLSLALCMLWGLLPDVCVVHVRMKCCVLWTSDLCSPSHVRGVCVKCGKRALNRLVKERQTEQSWVWVEFSNFYSKLSWFFSSAEIASMWNRCLSICLHKILSL